MESVSLQSADFRAMLDLLAVAHTTTGTAEFADVLMHSLSDVVPCDLISYNEIDLTGGATQTFFEPVLAPRPELEESFGRLIEQHPLVTEYARTRDPSPLRMSDFISLRELQRRDIYAEVFQPLETNHQLAFSLALDAEIVIGIGLNRRVGDFSDREVAAMTVLQPHLTAAFHHAMLRQRQAADSEEETATTQWLSVLTTREGEVVALLALGQSNRQIARTLFLSERTVEKHVANAEHKLQVPSRTALVARLGSTRPPSRQ